MLWYGSKGPNKFRWYHDLCMCMRMLRFLLLLSCTIIMMILWTTPTWILLMNRTTYGGSKLNNTLFLVSRFFVLRSIFGNILGLCFSKFCFWPSALGLFQPIAGVHFYPVNLVWFFCHKIICVCCGVVGVSVAIMEVSFCIIFYGMGDRLVIILYPYRHSDRRISSCE